MPCDLFEEAASMPKPKTTN